MTLRTPFAWRSTPSSLRHELGEGGRVLFSSMEPHTNVHANLSITSQAQHLHTVVGICQAIIAGELKPGGKGLVWSSASALVPTLHLKSGNLQVKA